MIVKTLMDSTCFKYFLRSLLRLLSVISEDDIISRPKILRCPYVLFNLIRLHIIQCFCMLQKLVQYTSYWESLRRNSKYHRKIVTRNTTLGAEYMQRKLNPFKKMTLLQPHTKFVIGEKSVSSLVNGGLTKSRLISFST